MTLKGLVRTFAVMLLPLTVAGCAESILDQIPLTPTPVIVSETFTGSITVNGAATHNFFSSATGSVTATLVSLGENPPANVGLSLGTWSGIACNIVLANDKAVQTSVIVGTVTSLGGSLCVRIYDVGALTESVAYEIKVDHP